MRPEHFVAEWTRRTAPERELFGELQDLVTVPEGGCQNAILTEQNSRFLREAGLPMTADPELSFRELASGLRRVHEVWRGPDHLEIQAAHQLEHLLVIGQVASSWTGEYGPLCLDERDGSSLFFVESSAPETPIFVNSSIPFLAEFLLAFHDLLHNASSSGTADRVDALSSTDGKAMLPHHFWPRYFRALNETLRFA